MDYKVDVAQFEGPLDLLLSLIEDQKLDITRLSLAQITDQYLVYVRAQEYISLEQLSQFLEVAARLILIKSQALLPLLSFDEEDEADLAELERQLEAFKVIKNIIPAFAHVFNESRPHFTRKGMWGVAVQYCPPEHLSVYDLEQAFLVSLSVIPQVDALEEKIVQDVISLKKRIIDIQDMVASRAQVAFSEMIANTNDANEVVVSFLALLELVKQKVITAQQDGVFDEIVLRQGLQEETGK